MKEIKFRALWTDGCCEPKWVYGYLTERDRNILIDPGGEEGAFIIITKHENSVGQYTGLKDKNGVEIYDGDIILDDSISFVDFGVHFERLKFSVKYNQATCGFMRFDEEHKTFSGNIGLFSKENIEIIGNIYEGEVRP